MKNESDADLITRAKALHWAIFVNETWSTHEIMEFDAICKELQERGYKLVESLEVVKDEPEEEESA